jgi:hypothetical protein
MAGDVAIFDWPKIVPVLVGGGISLVTALALFSLNFWIERRKKAFEKKQQNANLAISGYRKLLQFANLGENLENYITSAIKETIAAGIKSDDAFAHVPAAVGLFPMPERMMTTETVFMMTKDHSELLTAVGLFEERMINNCAIMDRYNDLRERFDNWTLEQVGIESLFDGVIATTKIETAVVQKYDVKRAQLNKIIATLVEHLEVDNKTAAQILADYVSAARSAFGDLFPKIEIVNRGKRYANP